jgi:hypothetical protein
MIQPAAPPFSHFYNLGRLGKAGDTASFTADLAQRTAIATWSGVLSVDAFAVTVDIRKLGSTRFRLDYGLTARVTQACVVTLAPVPAVLARDFSRELHFVGIAHRSASPVELGAGPVFDPEADEAPEDIESLHYDLAGPALEEYSLALDPYPRSPGAEFPAGASEADTGRETPFAVLKSLKGRS